MNYGSVCSGIEAATQAWKPLKWSPVFFSEIDKFPSAVLAHHYGSNMPDDPMSGNGVPNYGDMTKFKEWPDAEIDVLVGGTPCQSFSIAGLRKGLADPRGNLMLTYGAIAERYKPKWIVWENVFGVLSSNKGRDFGTFLRLLGELGYGFAYRVLDAQYVRVDGFGRAVPQRRRRVFVVGYLGDWRRAAAVLFEPESLSGNPAPFREAPKEVAGTIDAGAARRRGNGVNTGILVPQRNAARMTAIGEYEIDGTASTLKQRDHKDATDLVFDEYSVRRLTATETARAQGFPDDYCRIPWRGRPADQCPDGPQYKAYGNSMAVNCMRWIGRRIEFVEGIKL